MAATDHRAGVARALSDFLTRAGVAAAKCPRCGSTRFELVYDGSLVWHHCVPCGKEWGHTPLTGGAEGV